MKTKRVASQIIENRLVRQMNTLKKLYLCLKYELPNIEVDAELSKKAIIPIERMLELSKYTQILNES